jgi:hypothetical protein
MMERLAFRFDVGPDMAHVRPMQKQEKFSCRTSNPTLERHARLLRNSRNQAVHYAQVRVALEKMDWLTRVSQPTWRWPGGSG